MLNCKHDGYICIHKIISGRSYCTNYVEMPAEKLKVVENLVFSKFDIYHHSVFILFTIKIEADGGRKCLTSRVTLEI